jgi:integrase
MAPRTKKQTKSSKTEVAAPPLQLVQEARRQHAQDCFRPRDQQSPQECQAAEKVPITPVVVSKKPTGLVCVVCSKPFTRSKNLTKKAKVCTPFSAKHITRFEKQGDGSTKKIACKCCRCLYKKTLSKNRSLDGKLIPISRVKEFLDLTKTHYPEVHLAFRVGLNAMLRVTELSDVEIVDLEEYAKPLPRLMIKALKKTVKMSYGVDIDPQMAKEIREHIAGRVEGRIFDIPVRTLQHKFTQVMKRMGLGLSIHALRHTGISNRARTCKTMDELNYLRVQARHESIETTKLYMGFEDKQRIDMASRVAWF